MGLEAWQTCGKLARLSGFNSAGGTADSEHLFGAQFFFHGREIMPRPLLVMLVNFAQKASTSSKPHY
jgi:hypothetical protein